MQTTCKMCKELFHAVLQVWTKYSWNSCFVPSNKGTIITTIVTFWTKCYWNSCFSYLNFTAEIQKNLLQESQVSTLCFLLSLFYTRNGPQRLTFSLVVNSYGHVTGKCKEKKENIMNLSHFVSFTKTLLKYQIYSLRYIYIKYIIYALFICRQTKYKNQEHICFLQSIFQPLTLIYPMQSTAAAKAES